MQLLLYHGYKYIYTIGFHDVFSFHRGNIFCAGYQCWTILGMEVFNRKVEIYFKAYLDLGLIR